MYWWKLAQLGSISSRVADSAYITWDDLIPIFAPEYGSRQTSTVTLISGLDMPVHPCKDSRPNANCGTVFNPWTMKITRQSRQAQTGAVRFVAVNGHKKKEVSNGKEVRSVQPEGYRKLPDDKPIVYKILTGSGDNNYTGIAKRGRVQERLAEHLPGGKDYVPGTKVRIEQMPSIQDAEAKEQRIISRSQPPYNDHGK